MGQSYPLVPFSCPAGQLAYGFNPNAGGWLCAAPYPSSNINGTFTCPTMTLQNGIVTAAQSNTCGGGGGSAVLLVGGDSTSCLLVGGDTTSCLLVGGS